MLNRFFQIAENRTTVGRELLSGVTTFAAMGWLLLAGPALLAQTGMDRGALTTAVALAAAASTAVMALLTNYPIAVAPGLGLNAMFTFALVLNRGIPWSEALGMVFVSGVLFLLLSLSGLREKLIAAIPFELKLAVTAGIGLLLIFTGLKNGGVVVTDPHALLALGKLTHGPVALGLFGIALTAVLVARRAPAALLLSVGIVTVMGLFVRAGGGRMVTELPETLLALPASPEPVLLELSFQFLSRWNAVLMVLPIVLTLLLVEVADNIGTLLGVGERAGLMRPDGSLPRGGRVLVANSLATLLSALAGTPPAVSSIESAAGVEAGGRTGLTALTVAALILLALFFTPLLLVLPAAATAPLLVVVGVRLIQPISALDLKDIRVAAPAVLTMVGIPLTFSIANGIGLGLITTALLALALRAPRQFTPTGVIAAAVFFLHFFKLWPFR